jgi:zinc transport system substrate-binding protein
MRHSFALLGLAAVFVAGGCKQDRGKPAPASAPAPTSTTPTPAPVPVPGADTLAIGVTLHPYYAWTANVVKDLPGATVVAVLPGDVDAGNYQPATADIAKLERLDAIVVNGLGHDDFIDAMITASGNTKLVKIAINAETPTLKSAHGEAVNSHTFISFTNAIQQTDYLARRLAELRPAWADRLAANAEAYGDRLAKRRTYVATRLADAKVKRVVTVHDGYSYLLQELGIELAGVVEPAHGLVPSAAELTEMIALMKREKITVVLAEESFPEKLLTALKAGTGASVYLISHVASGAYTPDIFERVMVENTDVLIKALVDDPK